MRRFLLAAAVAAASVMILSACASSAGGRPALGMVWPEPPAGEVVGQGTVLDADGSVRLCLGAVAESFPPQCAGIPVSGWSWDGVEGSETSGTTRWGAYAVQGTYDGETLQATQPPILLALYDPLPQEDPTGGEPGTATDAELATVQDAVPEALGDALLTSSVENGRLWADVVWDDGTFQDAADAEYGEGLVVVRPALREVG